MLCAAPAYLAAHGTPGMPQELARHNCLAYSYFGKSEWELAHMAGGVVAVAVNGNLTSNESMALLAAAVQGAGLAMQPRFVAQPLVAAGQLREILPDWQPQALGIHAIYTSRQHMPPALRALLDYLVAWFAAHEGQF